MASSERQSRVRRAGGLAVSAAVAFAWLWARLRLDMAIWMAVFGTPCAIAARLPVGGGGATALAGR
jgi:hypothetical protein